MEKFQFMQILTSQDETFETYGHHHHNLKVNTQRAVAVIT